MKIITKKKKDLLMNIPVMKVILDSPKKIIFSRCKTTNSEFYLKKLLMGVIPFLRIVLRIHEKKIIKQLDNYLRIKYIKIKIIIFSIELYGQKSTIVPFR